MSGILDIGWAAARLGVIYGGAPVYWRSLEEAGLANLARAVAQRLQIAEEPACQLLEDGCLSLAAHGPGQEPEQPARPVSQRGAPPLEAQEARPVLLEYVDAMLRELNVSFSYASHQYPDAPLERVVLMGGGAEAIGGLDEQLARRLGVPVQIARPADIIDSNAADETGGATALLMSIGLAGHQGVSGS
jgi:Tfp pilus assembly PilM family ATPase